MAGKFLCRKDAPVVMTDSGKLRGFQWNDIYIFKGVQYAKAKRFQMPEKVEPWDGVKDALSYGFVCPLLEQDTPNCEILIPHRYWPMDEDCLNLNIWTKSLDQNAKKPVMVWLHGGGFVAGSSIEHEAYDGMNMCDYGDVVVVSINHRLNILGYLDLSDFGEKYKGSGNAGTADIVAALAWIHENIAGFGGDPDNVTLFGQSGGGMKINCLLQTPAADGLFHKGIIQSGVIAGYVPAADPDHTKIVKALMDEVGVEAVEELENVPYRYLAEAYNKVSPALAKEGYYVGCAPIQDENYAGDPLEVGFREEAKKIPIMIGSVFGEFDFGVGIWGKSKMTETEKMELLRGKYGDTTDELLALFKEAYPDNNIVDLYCLDSFFRVGDIEYIKERMKDAQADTYSYMFTYEFPLDDGKNAWHCSEIPFVFHNAEKIPLYQKDGVTEKIQDDFFGAWMSFAKTGVPTVKGVEWKKCEPEKEYMLIFDEECDLRCNYDHELIAAHTKAVGLLKDNKVENAQH